MSEKMVVIEMEKLKLRKSILSIIALAILAVCFAPAAAQPVQLTTATDLTTAKKTRLVNIYLSKRPDENRPEIPGHIVAVKRRIFDYEPLYGALTALMAGETEAERNHGIARNFGNVELFSARIRNRTAEINFKYEAYELSEDNPKPWEEYLLESDFTETVERTARQFAGVKRVSICINSIKDYANLDESPAQCPFEMFAAPPPRALEPGEMWTVEISLNKNDAPFTAWGARQTQTVKRQVRAEFFLTDTLKALVAGATEAERKQGWSSSTYGAQFVSAWFKDKKVFVRFTMPPGVKFPDRIAQRVLYYAAADTALKAGNFNDVEVCLDGVSNFYEEDNSPPMPCEPEPATRNEKEKSKDEN